MAAFPLPIEWEPGSPSAASVAAGEVFERLFGRCVLTLPSAMEVVRGLSQRQAADLWLRHSILDVTTDRLGIEAGRGAQWFRASIAASVIEDLG